MLSVPLLSALATPEHVLPPEGSGEQEVSVGLVGGRAHVEAWQARHGVDLPPALAAFLVAPGATWEARLAAWLLWLVQRRRKRRQQQQQDGVQDSAGDSSSGSHSGSGSGDDLWDLYADSLPRPEEQTTFYDFAAAEADAWLALAPWRVRVCAPLCASICLM